MQLLNTSSVILMKKWRPCRYKHTLRTCLCASSIKGHPLVMEKVELCNDPKTFVVCGNFPHVVFGLTQNLIQCRGPNKNKDPHALHEHPRAKRQNEREHAVLVADHLESRSSIHSVGRLDRNVEICISQLDRRELTVLFY